MTKTKELSLAVGMGLMLVVSAAHQSVAQPYYYEHDDNGTVWSDYPGYTDRRAPARRQQQNAAARARAQVPSDSTPASANDNPPGSQYEEWGNADSMGCPC